MDSSTRRPAPLGFTARREEKIIPDLPARFVLYHENCWDGFAAAYAAREHFRGLVRLMPVRHGTPMPEIPDGSEVYILDFSYPLEEILALGRRSANVLVIDHHPEAAALAYLEFVVYDENRSAAALAWEYFLPDEQLPPLVTYIEDRDLGRDALDHTTRINAALRSYPMETDTFAKLLARDVNDLAEEGRHVERFRDTLVEDALRNHQWIKLKSAQDEEHWVPAVNSRFFASDICRALLSASNVASVAAVYYDRGDGKRVFELRGRGDGGVSARTIAVYYGGGGHARAAGFTVEPFFLGEGRNLNEASAKIRGLRREVERSNDRQHLLQKELERQREKQAELVGAADHTAALYAQRFEGAKEAWEETLKAAVPTILAAARAEATGRRPTIRLRGAARRMAHRIRLAARLLGKGDV